MEQRQASGVEKLFDELKTVCIGRFVLEVPIDSDVIYGPARVPYLIERLPGDGPKFEAMVQRRLTEIAQDRPRARGPLAKSDSMFGKVLDGSSTDQKIVFGASESIGTFYSIESFHKVGDDLYIQRTTAFGDEYRDAVAQFKNIARSLQRRSEQSIPTTSGTCIDGAILLDWAGKTYEAVTLGIRLRKHPDVHFSIEMINKDVKVEGDSLESRIKAAEEDARRAGAGHWLEKVKILRRGERKIDRWIGTEFLARKPTIGHVIESHEFAFHSHGEPGNSMLPALDITLDTGVRGNKRGGVKPSVSDDDALYVWKRLTSSIRLRPAEVSSK